MLGICVGAVGDPAGQRARGRAPQRVGAAHRVADRRGWDTGRHLLGFPLPVFVRAVKALRDVFSRGPRDEQGADRGDRRSTRNKARREGIIALEAPLESASDPFLKKALMLAVDGADSKTMRDNLELMIDHYEEDNEQLGQGVGVRRRLRTHHRHHRRRDGPHSRDAEPVRRIGRGQGHRGRVRGHHLRRGAGQPAAAAGGGQAQAASSRPRPSGSR